MAKWALAFILLMFATGDGFPIYFSERPYRTLDQLDEALANGEITQEYYDEYLDGLLDSTVLPSDSAATDIRAGEAARSPTSPRWNYSSTYRQKLETGYSSTRYDRIGCTGKGIRIAIGLEQPTQAAYSIRSLAISFRRLGWQLNLGDLTVPYANGLTIGRPALHKELHNDNDFAARMLYPIRNRKNGIELEREVGILNARFYLSRLQGERYYVRSYGGDLRLRNSAIELGMLALRQQAGERSGRKRTITYLAPHATIGDQDRKLSSEFSFQIGGASAHSMRGEFQSGHLRQAFEFFSYGTRFENLESGGYAYSDFDDVTIDEIGLEYRDKRPGRIGAAIEQSFSINAESISGQIVRWDNRLDGRKCVATRVQHAHDARTIAIRTQAIYQDLDIEGGSDIRRLVVVATETQPTEALEYEIQHKIEQRILNGSKSYPFRSRHDFAWQFDSRLKSVWMINFYDGDLKSDANSQVTLAGGIQIASSKDLNFSARCQTRYRFALERFDNWELRLDLKATT